MPASFAYLLVAHGSSDPRPHQALAGLAEQLRHRLVRASEPPALVAMGQRLQQSPAEAHLGPGFEEPIVATAVLECHPLPLHQQIQQLVYQHPGLKRIRVLPLFLLPGVHVMEDIPTEVALAQGIFSDRVEVEISPYLGSHPAVLALLSHILALFPGAKPILLAHGSRRPGGNIRVETLATALGAIPAYWTIAPGLETCIPALYQQQQQTIVILPYFLFSGSTTDGIADRVEALRQRHPDLTLHLAPALDQTPALPDVVGVWMGL